MPGGPDAPEKMVLASEELREPLLRNNGGPPSTVSGSFTATTNAPRIREEITRITEGDHAQNNASSVQSDETRTPGISMFQG